MSKQRFVLLLMTAFSTGIFASKIPVATDKSAYNLQHYLDYRLEAASAFSCDEQRTHFRCLSKKHKSIETDELDNTIETSFDEAELRFSDTIAPLLNKASFQMTMDEIEKKLNGSKDGRASKKEDTLSTTREDALHRALFGDLELIRINMLDIKERDPLTHIHLDELLYKNKMSDNAKGISFSERVFGDILISYKNAVIETDGASSFYQTLPMMIEEWLETDDKDRANYVKERSQTLYADQLKSPSSGNIHINSRYLGSDAIELSINAKSSNRHGTSGIFVMKSELHNISTSIKQTNKALASGTPDVLFHSLKAISKTDASRYRALLKQDKRFAAYMNEYDQSIQAYLDKQSDRHKNDPTLQDWYTQLKDAISRLISGKADSLEISIRNRSGVTAMRLFGMIMGQMMSMTAKDDNSSARLEKIIAHTAAQNLDIHIEAR